MACTNTFNYKKFFCIAALIILCITAKAQYDTQLSNYMLVPGLYNPAVTGANDNILVNALMRQQWTGIDGAPSTLLLQASIPKKTRRATHGFGVLLMNESTGLFKTQMLQLQYSYKINFYKGELSLGLQCGALQEGFNGSDIYIPESDYHSPSEDAIPGSDINASVLDFATGIWYKQDKFFTGFSVSHLAESKIKMKENNESSSGSTYTTYASRTYYLTGGYNIILPNPLFTLQPVFLIQTDMTAWQESFSTRLAYKNLYWGGIGWRVNDAAIISAGIKVAKCLLIGYSYDISTKNISTTGGSHEIFISYSKKIDTNKSSKRQKSVRIL